MTNEPRMLSEEDVALDLEMSPKEAKRLMRMMPHVKVGARIVRVESQIFEAWKGGITWELLSRYRQSNRELIPFSEEVPSILPDVARDSVFGESSVYALQAGPRGPIKIGYTVNIVDRMHLLQSGCPWKLRLIAQWPGEAREESHAHMALARFKIRSEWFMNMQYVRKLLHLSHCNRKLVVP